MSKTEFLIYDLEDDSFLKVINIENTLKELSKKEKQALLTIQEEFLRINDTLESLRRIGYIERGGISDKQFHRYNKGVRLFAEKLRSCLNE